MRNMNRSGVDRNAKINNKRTLLHINASKGLTDTVNILLKTGADINAEDWNKRTPLHCSIESGHKDVAEILLKAGANINAQNDKLVAPLHVAAYKGHIEIIKTLLKADANANAADYKKWTPLHYAASCGHAEIVETLLKADANASAEDYKKWTPLHYAACCGDAEIVETLPKADAKTNAADCKKLPPLPYFACGGHAEIVEMLLKADANINAADDKKSTPLHYAAWKGNKKMVKFLLKAEANVNAENDKKWTPLHAAVDSHQTEIVEMLLKSDANANAADDKKMTPLHYAVSRRRAQIVEMLLKAGANVNAECNKKMTSLHCAACCMNAEIVEMLLKAGANVNAECNKKMTSLHCAACHGHAEIVEMLLKAGANVNAKCDLGHTPLFYSNRDSHHEVSECLLKSGATVRQGVWKRFINHVSSALTIKTVSHTQSTKIVHVLRKSTDGVSRHSEYSLTSIMACEPRNGHTDVTPSTAFANDIQQSSSTADCVTLPSSGMTANSCTVISDDTEATTSALSLGRNLQKCEDIRNQVEDHLAKFSPLQNKSHSEYSHTSIMTCEPWDGHTDVTPCTTFANDIQQGSCSADCMTLTSSGMTANSCTVISDDIEATTSALPLCHNFQKCEDIRNQIEDHLAKFPLQNKSHSKYSLTSTMACEPRNGHTDVTPCTAFANGIQQGSCSADCMTLSSSGTTANSCTVISDDTEATTSVLPLGLSLQKCEDIINQVEDHLAKFPPHQNKSHKGQCCTDVASVFENGNIIIDKNVVQNYAPESPQISNTECLSVSHTELLTLNSKVSLNRTERADGDEDTDDSVSNGNRLGDSNEDIQEGSSSADCVTLQSSGRTANSCAVISDNPEATTSALPLGLSLVGCEDVRKQVEDHWAKFPLQQKSHNGQCSTDVASMIKNGNIIINICPTTINVVQKNYTQESLHIGNTGFVNVNSSVNIIRGTDPADSDADTDDSNSNNNGFEDSNEVST